MTFRYRYRKQIIIISVIIILLGSLSYYLYYNKKEKEDDENKSILLESTKKKKNISKKELPTEIMVDVKGEVNNAGIYTLKSGSRVIDAINMAGGLTSNANTSVLNLSKKLTDEMVIIIYSNYEVQNFEKTKEVESIVLENCKTGYDNINNDACIETEKSTEKTGKVSINSATIEQLMTLSGVGEAKAKSIIEYRDKNGGFKNIEDIKNVSGIGDALFDKIKEDITL